MLICELFQLIEAEPRLRDVPRIIRAARGRFKKELINFINAYHEQFEIPFQEFLTEKATLDPPPLFGIKDGPLGRNLKKMPVGTMHTHIVRGVALVVYKVDHKYLTLYRVCDHADTNPTALSPLADLIRSIDSTDQWDIIPLPIKAIDSAISEPIRLLFNEMAQTWNDLKILRQFSKMTDDSDPAGARSGMKAYLDRFANKFPTLQTITTSQLRHAAVAFIDQHNQESKT